MVDDAEDRRRWARVHAVDPRTPDRSRRPLLEHATRAPAPRVDSREP